MMAEEKGMVKFFVYVFMILILFMIMIPVIFSFSGKVIKLELIGMVFLILLSLIGFVGYRTSWGERVLFFVFLFSLANLLLIWHFTDKLFLLPLFFAVVGFLMSLPRKGCGCEEVEEPEVKTYGEVVENPVVLPVEKEAEVVEEKVVKAKVTEKKPVKKTTVKNVVKKKAVHSPGKYVASTGGSVYHEPKCDWAKRIVKKRQVWFDDKRSANKKGYRGHSCVQ
tara:strand:- start:633 stop:1301 length:669 start_codon:yes stop_codon:yes gene_type:complete